MRKSCSGVSESSCPSHWYKQLDWVCCTVTDKYRVPHYSLLLVTCTSIQNPPRELSNFSSYWDYRVKTILLNFVEYKTLQWKNLSVLQLCIWGLFKKASVKSFLKQSRKKFQDVWCLYEVYKLGLRLSNTCSQDFKHINRPFFKACGQDFAASECIKH